VTIVEFADFRCSYCRHTLHVLDRVLSTYPENVRLVFVHFPVVSDASSRAAVAAVAAQRQGRFWEMHDFLFRQQGIPLRMEAVLGEARSLGLDEERFASDLRDAEVIAVVQADFDEARRVGLRGTPAFFVNGRRLRGSRSFEAFRSAIDAELSRSSSPPRTTSRPARNLPDAHPGHG